MVYSKVFKDKAIKAVLTKKDSQSILEIAKQLNVSNATLYKWVKGSKNSSNTQGTFSIKEKLQMLKETHTMSSEELSAYCRKKGLFAHQLQEFEEAFLEPKRVEDSDTKKALEEEKSKTKILAKDLRRKEKALAETAALLVLQKKFQALFEDEEV